MNVPATKPRVRPDLTVVELDGEAVIYDERTDDIHHLNPTATIVFSLCDGTASFGEIVADIAEVFTVPPDQVARDVRSLLREFRRSGLLQGGKARTNGRAGTTTREAS